MERKGIQSDCHYMHLIRAYKSWNSEAHSSAVRSLRRGRGRVTRAASADGLIRRA